ncbi:hypothetical protein GYH30_033311 [Glycine max]|nr:hypothetical protein GYH30_033311 [Glycine max]
MCFWKAVLGVTLGVRQEDGVAEERGEAYTMEILRDSI